MEEYGWLLLPAALLVVALAVGWRARARRGEDPAPRKTLPRQRTALPRPRAAPDPYGAETVPNPRVMEDIAAAVEVQRRTRERRAAGRLALDQARAALRERAEAEQAAQAAQAARRDAADRAARHDAERRAAESAQAERESAERAAAAKALPIVPGRADTPGSLAAASHASQAKAQAPEAGEARRCSPIEPTATLDRPAQSSSAPTAPMPAVVAVAAPPLLVMVVDDSKLVRVKTSRLLVAQGFRVVEAADGQEALRLIETEWPDVLITDVEMPGLDGFALTRHLRQQPRGATLPIIMITSADDRLQGAAREAGVSVVLGKPYPEAELIAHVRQKHATVAPCATLTAHN